MDLMPALGQRRRRDLHRRDAAGFENGFEIVHAMPPPHYSSIAAGSSMNCLKACKEARAGGAVDDAVIAGHA